MKKSNESARIAQILNEKQSIAICLPQNPNLDAVAAATGLYLTRLHMGKQAGIACLDVINPQFDLVGQDKIQTTMVAEGNTLVVSFPYQDGAVDKVTYNIENDRFNLLIQPKEGVEKLNHNGVKFRYTGGKADVIITIYAPTLNSLGDLYNNQKDQFTGVEIINIDRHFTNNGYGTVNVVDKKAASISEIVISLLRSLNAKMDKDAASNFYAGIVAATNNFSSHAVSAQTFESSAFLLNSGAQKKPIGMPQGAPQAPMGMNMTPMPSMQAPMQPQVPQMPQQQVQQPMAQPMQPQVPQMPQQQPIQQPIQEVPQPEEQQEEIQQFEPEIPEEQEEMINPGTAENKESSSQSWLKPKIFKGSNLI